MHKPTGFRLYEVRWYDEVKQKNKQTKKKLVWGEREERESVKWSCETKFCIFLMKKKIYIAFVDLNYVAELQD